MILMYKLLHFEMFFSMWVPPKILQSYGKKFAGFVVNALKTVKKRIRH